MSSDQKQFSVSGITARLFEIINEMTDSQKKDLLIMLGDQRQYERLPYLMQVFCETEKICFTDFILDISPGGVFLETIQELFAGQKLKMTFRFKGVDDPLVITGAVAWIGGSGAGIRFLFDNENQKEMMIDLVSRLG